MAAVDIESVIKRGVERALNEPIMNGKSVMQWAEIGIHSQEQPDKDINVPNKWISVEKKLPENTDTVLIAHRGGVSFGWYNGRYWERGVSTKHREIRTVTHWMPLPEPPKEVKQDGMC